VAGRLSLFRVEGEGDALCRTHRREKPGVSGGWTCDRSRFGASAEARTG